MDEIKTISYLEHVRLKPLMYLERIGDGSNANDGIYTLIRQVVDVFQEGCCNEIQITISGNCIKMSSNCCCNNVNDIFINANPNRYNTAGMGTSDSCIILFRKLAFVNALSESMYIYHSNDKNHTNDVYYKKGVMVSHNSNPIYSDYFKVIKGLTIIFRPDPEIFGRYEIKEEHVERIIADYYNRESTEDGLFFELQMN